MIKNEFSDNGTAIVDIENNVAFSYVFSSDAHIIAEKPKAYRYATQIESIALGFYLRTRRDHQPRTYRLAPADVDDLEKLTIESIVITDRQRSILYNGEEIMVCKYHCKGCEMLFVYDHGIPRYCPSCGTQYKTCLDASM